MRVRICLAGTLVRRGGIQTHFRWLASALAEQGYSVLILSFGARPAPVDFEAAAELARLGDIEVDFVSDVNGDSISKAAVSAARALRRLWTFKPDVYLACGTGWNLFIPALFAPRPVTRVFHEVMSGRAHSALDPRRVARYMFERIIAQANGVADTFTRSFGGPKPLVLPAFPEPLERTADVGSAVQRRIPRGTIRAAFFGRLARHKQALWLVRQWPELSVNLRELHIFGTGPEEEAIAEAVREQELSGKVFFHGEYPCGQPYVDLLRSFDLTLLPTIGDEGAPLVLLESIACGVPFVAFGVGGIPDYRNDDCEVVVPDGAEAFLAAVNRMALRLDRGEVDQGRLQALYLSRFSYRALKTRWTDYLLSLQNREPDGAGASVPGQRVDAPSRAASLPAERSHR